ncbi:SAM-dependent methyltransferase [Pseudalgibacter alginicilyticus]|uniref:SAM-dependent methyltransferase n=1 Tax=Pseudalgibacter alginicilyticus TaxID=1736674 RepID=A0A0P0D649_9FLAO|nr:SAM-dependent methyltransferase [Pseudalgibacter alginicilyticus]ALJ04161.1 SAM-dependent methyltransferase [Pseudalgibacter alginicilyticus]
MNPIILNTEIQEFINKNLNSNIGQLLLKGTTFFNVETKIIIEQIEAKKRCEKKLSTWFKTPNIYYPNKLNIEQTSSEITASYKSKLLSGESIIDLTGGFGVDCLYFSKQFHTVTHCEINENLSRIVTHNNKQFNIKNIKTIAINGIEQLQNCSKNYDWIYIDPSRRHDIKGKVFFLNDCLPNVPEHLGMLFKHSKNIMIKTSPLLDLSIGINELNYVKTIHVVAVKNEVKELLWVLEDGFNGQIQIETVHIKNDTEEHFKFSFENEKLSKPKYSEPLTYLFESNSAILKAGAFNSVSNQLNVFKLHKHSHLYTSDTLIDFPGRSFKIYNIIPYNKKEIKKLSITKANITTRNFPETVQQLRKKFNIKEGGEYYLFFTTNIHDQKIILISLKTPV